MDQRTFSVTELNQYLKGLLEREPTLRDVFVQGELSNYKIYPSGHHYFTLKDAESSLKCVMFKGYASRLRFQPENGLKVTLLGRVSVFVRDGAYQLNCTAMIPSGMGEVQLAFEQLKARLSAEGLFDPAHKKPLPAFPSKVAIITSLEGAVVHDMVKTMAHRWPVAKVLVLPVRVQGTEAPPEIAGAIRYVNEFQIADVILTGRGGGSMEELWAFNDERVVRAIYASRVPVITCVGHAPDRTLSDAVSDLSVITPTEAGEKAVPDWRTVQQRLEEYRVRSQQALEKKLNLLSQRLEALESRPVLQDPGACLDLRRMDLDRLQDRITAAEDRLLDKKRQQFVRLGASLDAMSPLRVLARGYAFATAEDGSNIKAASELTEGQRISVRFADGAADCRVEQLHEGGKQHA